MMEDKKTPTPVELLTAELARYEIRLEEKEDRRDVYQHEANMMAGEIDELRTVIEETGDRLQLAIEDEAHQIVIPAIPGVFR